MDGDDERRGEAGEEQVADPVVLPVAGGAAPAATAMPASRRLPIGNAQLYTPSSSFLGPMPKVYRLSQ